MVYPQCLELKANTKSAINPPTPTLVSSHPTGVLIPPLSAITVVSSAITDDTGLKETESSRRSADPSLGKPPINYAFQLYCKKNLVQNKYG